MRKRRRKRRMERRRRGKTFLCFLYYSLTFL